MKSMKSTRKVLITILILVFACMFFVACNDKGNLNDNNSSQQVLRKPTADPDPNNPYDFATDVIDYRTTTLDLFYERIAIVFTNSESLNNLFYDYKLEDFDAEKFERVSERYPAELQWIRDRVVKNDFGTQTKKYTRSLWLTLKNPSRENVLDYIDELSADKGVLYAEADVDNHPAGWFATANDELIDHQQSVFEKIELFDAWDTTTGSSNVKVGVIDTGIYKDHPDLTSNVNTALGCGSDYSSDPYYVGDTQYHGTMVAGIIGAKGNNGIGISGVCQNVSLVSLRADGNVFDSNDGMYLEDVECVINAIVYATNNNIPILNFSGGFYGDDKDPQRKRMEEAINNYKGLLIVGSGNKNLDVDSTAMYPQDFDCDNMIVVGAVNRNDTKWSRSNYGSTKVDLFADGNNIETTFPYESYTYAEQERLHVTFSSGTSLAALFVTGVAALILSKCPTLSAAELKGFILDNVDAVPSLVGKCVTGGRLNAKKAVEAAHAHNKLTCTYTSKTIRTGHYVNCNYCDYSTFEAHMWNAVKVPGTDIVKHYLCGGCGAITDIIAIPNPTSLLTPNALALMNEKESSTSGDYEFEITQDIVFVKKNGKYYLMVACDENGNIIADLSKVLKKEETI